MLLFLFTKTPLLYFVQSLWRDEAFSYLLSKKNLLSIVVLTAKDFNPPFYYLILHFWIRLFGGSEIALRSLSLIFYWATIYVIFLFFQNICKFSFKKSLTYLPLVIINPILVYYAFETRMYTALTFFASLSFYAFYKKKSRLYLYSSILGLYTHYFMIFVLMVQLIFILLAEKRKKLSHLKNIFISFAVFLPWLIYFLQQKFLSSLNFWVEKPKLFTIANLLGLIYLGHEAPGYTTNINLLEKIVFWTNLVLISIFILGFLSIKKKVNKNNKRLFPYLLLWSIFIPFSILLLSFIKPLFLPRYLIFVTVGFLILIIYNLDKINLILRIPLIVVLLILTLVYQKQQISYRQKTDTRKIVMEIRSLAKKNDRLYVTNELDFLKVQYYFPENQVYIFGKSYQEIPDFVGKILIPSERIINNLPIYPNKAFILNSDGSYEIKAVY